MLMVFDAGYDVTRLALSSPTCRSRSLGRMRSDRVMRRPKPPWHPRPEGGRPPKHGTEFPLAKPETWASRRVAT